VIFFFGVIFLILAGTNMYLQNGYSNLLGCRRTDERITVCKKCVNGRPPSIPDCKTLAYIVVAGLLVISHSLTLDSSVAPSALLLYVKSISFTSCFSYVLYSLPAWGDFLSGELIIRHVKRCGYIVLVSFFIFFLAMCARLS